MTDSEKIRKIEKEYNFSTRQLAVNLGLKSAQNLYDIHRGRHGISKDLASIISAKYPNISLIWLLTGEGEMLKDTEPKQIAQPSDKEEYSRLLTIVESQQRIIESQQRTMETLVNQLKKGDAHQDAPVKCADVG